MSTASSIGAERRPLMQALILERRILFGCTVLVGLCTFVWITAVCTLKWVHIEAGTGNLFYILCSILLRLLTNTYFIQKLYIINKI